MSGQESIETPLVKVPLEALRRSTRERKTLLDELEAAVVEISKSILHGAKQDQAAALQNMLERLHSLKRKLDEVSSCESEDARRCKARLEHLVHLGAPVKDHAVDWNRQRLDRILVDYFLRSGYTDTALHLARESHIEARVGLIRARCLPRMPHAIKPHLATSAAHMILSIKDLVDLHIFLGARGVLEALARHDCGPALAWCAENQGKLRKTKSKLEFKLRQQEFIELVRGERLQDAIAYARRHLAPWAATQLPELQRALAVLAFRAGTRTAPYVALFEEAAWASCAELFRKELYRLHSLTPVSLLAIHLQAGLSALKTSPSYEEGSSKEDPLRLQSFWKLAEGLPWAKHVHSKLICAITREVINEHNPPMVLPNGFVYSEKAVQDMAARSEGMFTCPRTGECYCITELRRAYIS